MDNVASIVDEISRNIVLLKKALGDDARLPGRPANLLPEPMDVETLPGDAKNFYFELMNMNPIWTVLTTVEEGRFLFANHAFFKISGYSQEEVLGKSAIQMRFWPDVKDRASAMRMLVDNGKLVNRQIHLRMKDGTVHNCSWSAWLLSVGGRRCVLSVLLDGARPQMQLDWMPGKSDASPMPRIDRRDGCDCRHFLASSLEQRVLPFIDQLKKRLPDWDSLSLLSSLEANLEVVMSALGNDPPEPGPAFTPAEIQVMKQIRQGRQSKEIAADLHVSAAAVHFHRRNIRKKLGLINAKVNLSAYLQANAHLLT